MTTDMSMAEARQILSAIRLAYERQDVRRVQAGNLICSTDCRVDPQNPDRVSIIFGGAFSARTFMSRAAVADALDQYEEKLEAACREI